MLFIDCTDVSGRGENFRKLKVVSHCKLLLIDHILFMISCVTLQHACSTQFLEYFTERPRRLVSCKTTTRHEDNPRTWLTQGNSNDTTYKRAPVVLFDDRYPIACSSIAIRSDLENEARRPSGFEKEIHRLDKHPCEIRRVISRENSTRNVQSTR